MEAHSSRGKSHAEDRKSINKLGVSLKESLHIEDDQDSSVDDDNSDIDEANRYTNLKVDEIKSAHKSPGKCAAFPYPNMMLPPSDSSTDDEEEDYLEENPNHSWDPNGTYSRSISLPSCSTLRSAIKGSGNQKKNRSVTWAASVYDPAPTVLSNLVKGGQKQRKQSSSKADKGKGNKKDKGKKPSSRGSSSKDKKAHRRNAGGSEY